jgi:hypothetical protein
MFCYIKAIQQINRAMIFIKNIFLFIVAILLSVILSALSIAFLTVFTTKAVDNIILSDMKEVNGLTWGTGNNLLTASLEKSVKDDYEYYVFTTKDVNNKAIFSQEFKLRTGLFGKCFVKAMQADDDPDFEVIFYTTNSSQRNSFFIDIINKKIEIKNFDNASSRMLGFA